MQKHVNLVDLVKRFPTNIYLQNLASIQKRTSPLKFAHLAEKSENSSISNLSTKLRARAALRRRGAEERHLSARSRALRQNGYGKAVLLVFLFVFLFFLFFLSNERPRYGKVLHGRKKNMKGPSDP